MKLYSYLKSIKLLIVIFIFALFVRFLFFPHNIYFGYDQARDAFAAQNILSGHIALLGPPTSFAGLFHGVLYYYLITPIYFLSGGNPVALSIFLKILNASGIFLIFFFALSLFKNVPKLNSTKIALIASLLYAVSFEQTQFSIYMGNPSPASLTIPLMFFGLSIVIFNKKSLGIILAVLGLGLSIEFEFALFYLIIPFLLISILFYKSFIGIPLKYFLIAALVGLFSISTYLIAELKYNFRTFHTLLSNPEIHADKSIQVVIQSYIDTLKALTSFNLTGTLPIQITVLLFLLAIYIFFLWTKKEIRYQLIFLGIYFFSLFFVYIIGGGRAEGEQLYYTNIGIAEALLIFCALITVNLGKIHQLLAVFFISFILANNLNMIFLHNPNGTVTSINVQQGMLLSDETTILDLIYQDARQKPFAIKSLSMPLYINTTWSYLFEWYGQNHFGYKPIWGDKSAAGYPGNLTVETAQNKLPPDRYLIIEPLRGIQSEQIDTYMTNENYFTKILWQKNIGQFVVQKRIAF